MYVYIESQNWMEERSREKTFWKWCSYGNRNFQFGSFGFQYSYVSLLSKSQLCLDDFSYALQSIEIAGVRWLFRQSVSGVRRIRTIHAINWRVEMSVGCTYNALLSVLYRTYLWWDLSMINAFPLIRYRPPLCD